MSKFKRLTATLSARIDQMVSDIENHEAVTDAYLRQMAKAIAEAKVREQQLHVEKQRLHQKVQEHSERISQWEARAVSCAQADRARALACVERAERLARALGPIQQQLEGLSQAADKLRTDIARSEQRLNDLKIKKSMLQARESAANSLKASTLQSGEPDTLSRSLASWEKNVLHAELLQSVSADGHSAEGLRDDACDALESEFAAQEQSAALSERLAALLSQAELEKPELEQSELEKSGLEKNGMEK